jgi:hypothetical protein
MSRQVEALCEKQYFDNDKGLLYYPNYKYEVDLDSDAALSFRLVPEDRAYAIESAKKRERARIEEKDEAAQRGFPSIYEMRKYDQEYGKPADKTEEPEVEKPKYVCRVCGRSCMNPQALKFHEKACGVVEETKLGQEIPEEESLPQPASV